jgi:hypothetical protein
MPRWNLNSKSLNLGGFRGLFRIYARSLIIRRPQNGMSWSRSEPIPTKALPSDVPLLTFGGFWTISIVLIRFCDA